MEMEDLFQQALGILSPWYIAKLSFDSTSNRLDIYIDFKRGSRFLDEETGSVCKVHDTQKKSWRHLDFFQYDCYLHARVPRIKRPDGRVKLLSPPWSGVVSGFTLLFEAHLIELCQTSPVHNISKLTGVSDYLLWRVLDVYVNAARFYEDLSAVKTGGLDETSVLKGHDYITLFVDMEKKRTIHISDGKGHETVKDFIEQFKVLHGNCDAVINVSCDMSKAFIKGVSQYLPNAAITFDKFHILKVINQGVDEVRRAEAKNNPLLKGTRYIFLKNDENLTSQQKETKKTLSLSRLNLKSVRAMNIREAFQQLYSLKSIEEFSSGLQKWYYWASHSQLPPMVKAAKTIKRHWDGVIRWQQSRINNGLLEGLNSVVQAAKRKARGYKHEHFKTIAYLLTGKLDLSVVNPFLPT